MYLLFPAWEGWLAAKLPLPMHGVHYIISVQELLINCMNLTPPLRGAAWPPAAPVVQRMRTQAVPAAVLAVAPRQVGGRARTLRGAPSGAPISDG